MGLRQKVTKRGVWHAIRNTVLLTAVLIIGINLGNGRIHLPGNSTQNPQLPARLNYQSVNDVYKALKENYNGKLTQQQLEDGLKHGLAESTKDPYTVFFTAKEAQKFNEDLNNSFSGIGAQLGLDENGTLQVISPIDGFPADKAGLKSKDLIATINGESTQGMSIDAAVDKIRGPAGSKVKLEVVRNRSQTLTFNITRENINIPSVKSKVLDNNIGYIQITSFSEDTSELARQQAQDLKNKGVKGIILDLRGNPGGLLDAAVNVSSLWLPQGKMVLQEKSGTKVNDTQYSTGGEFLNGVPTVVLIDGGSASASEITAGALRDNNAAYLIGEKSYGKGVVQQLINFRDDSQLKVTVASWYRPNGQNINKKGISPDKAIKNDEAAVKAGQDPQLQAAQAYLNR